jgi:hypothetical protein
MVNIVLKRYFLEFGYSVAKYFRNNLIWRKISYKADL